MHGDCAGQIIMEMLTISCAYDQTEKKKKKKTPRHVYRPNTIGG